MGYLHIDNLYKNQKVLEFPQVYALEKIHGTSAHIGSHDGQFICFSGGEKHENFIALFSQEQQAAVVALQMDLQAHKITFYGEAYGGKQQGMSKTYGKELKFVVFDVSINGRWLNVPEANELTYRVGLEFVHYVCVVPKLAVLDSLRDADSTQAIRNGMGPGLMQEGIVIRPLEETVDERGNRVIAKHKRAEFQETKTPREVDPDKQERLKIAALVAEEWVTDMRLTHVLDKFPDADITQTGNIIKAMIEDIHREGDLEIEFAGDTDKAIGRATALLFKKRLQQKMREDHPDGS